MSETHVQDQTIAGASPGPRLLITAGVHGDECEPMLAVGRLARSIDAATLAGVVTLVPIVNQPAFERAARCGPDGKDLARTCPGRVDGTITQQIAHELTALIRGADYYIDLHTGGIAYRTLPFSGYMLHRDGAVLDAQRRMARAFGLPLIWGTCAALDGRSLSMARDFKIPAIYAEYGGGVTFSRAAVDAYIDGCRRVMTDLGMIGGPKLLASESVTIEDDGPQSGHLQRNHPAACDGCFEAYVAVGDRVERGQHIGDVHDMDDGRVAKVHADQAGVVLVLRTLSKVSAGDGLVTIVNPSNAEDTHHV